MPTEKKYEKFKKAFGKRLKKQLKGMSDKKFADKMGVSVATVIAWKYGYRVPHLMQFRKLCKKLEIKPEALLYKEKT